MTLEHEKQELSLEAQWKAVEKIFEDNECANECPYLKTYDEWHPYGSTVAVETLYECSLLGSISGVPTQCPKFKEKT